MAEAENYDPLDDPWLWRIFLSRISGFDVDYDYRVIVSFADACEVDPLRVWLKLKPSITPPTAARH